MEGRISSNILSAQKTNILLSNIGESPQGAIIVFSHLIVDRHLNERSV